MTVKELYKELDTRIPRTLSCEWDNDGLMCCPDGDRQVKKVLVALDVTDKTIDAAIDGGYDLIVAHHPFIFKGLKSINDENHVAENAIRIIKNGISIFSFHTRLDAVEGGVNDTLATLLRLEDVCVFGEGNLGRIGYLSEEVSAEELAKRVKEALRADGVFLSDAGVPCKRIAVLGGGGDDFIASAIAAGADAYISGELKYHSMTDAPQLGINLISAGHFHTENPVCAALCGMIQKISPDIKCDIFYSNRIRLI